MTEAPAGADRTAGQFDQLLLDVKLSVPHTRPGIVSRAGLIERARTSGRRVVGLTAPPGYGKSTLLIEWARAETRPVGWVSLDRFDDDPAALLTLLAAAFSRVSAGNADLIADMGGNGVSLLGRAAPTLASAFRMSSVPFVLMLDDLHEIRSAACHDVLSVVISATPSGSQFVAASRFDQPHLPRLRASGDAFEILAKDLALDVRGAERIFADAHVELTNTAAAAVTQRTEGWPVGLYLAAVVAGDDPKAALAVTGEDRYLTDYLYHESLAHLPDDSQRFLRRTAVLDQLCAPLCDAVLGEQHAQNQLRRLESMSTFLVPLDHRRHWYRYHALFREFLLGELRRVEPGLVTKLHLRAAEWYETQGSSAMALEHLLNTDERDRSIELITALVLPTYQAGHISTVQRWFTTIGESAIKSYPPLAVLAGWIAVMTGQSRDALRWAAILDEASFAGLPLDGTASFESARAMLRAIMCAAGPEQALADAKLAVSQEPPWSPWYDTALCLQAEAELLCGRPDDAAILFAQSSTAAAAMQNTDSFVFSESQLALLAMDRGRWPEAADRLTAALAAVDSHRMADYPTSVLAFALAARLAVHRSDLAEAKHQLTRAMRARPSCTFAIPFIAVRVRLHTAKVYWSIGDQTAARHLLREIDDILLRRPDLGTLVDETRQLRRLVTSEDGRRPTGGSPLSPAELRILPYLQTHLTYGEIAQRLFVSRNTIRSEVASIYRKLGASSRSEAVRQATTTGLLGA